MPDICLTRFDHGTRITIPEGVAAVFDTSAVEAFLDADGDQWLWQLEESKELVAFAVTDAALCNEARIFIWEIGVSATARGFGFGTTLFREIARHAHEIERPVVGCIMKTDDDDVARRRRWFLKVGLRQEDPERDYWFGDSALMADLGEA
ncbi:GNAT family N-acetyltransferase [Ilumatobacter sp.]|uniref:GNAT family N-acetyltransferase n=1 Tax=Ilumatobacter sp. TaxID=1967498 RepID=UPI0037525C39